MTDKQLKLIEEEIIDEEEEVNELIPVTNLPTQVAPQEMGFDKMMELSQMLAKSTIVPPQYQHREENVFIALDLANRMGISAMTVMQNLYLIQGKPSFSGSFISALIHSSPLFTNVELVWVGEKGKSNYGAYIKALKNGVEVIGTTVTMDMANQEGWLKNPKWKSMPELMMSYRAYSFFGRVHASELLNGIYSTSEVEDFTPANRKVVNPYDKVD